MRMLLCKHMSRVHNCLFNYTHNKYSTSGNYLKVTISIKYMCLQKVIFNQNVKMKLFYKKSIKF